MKGNDLKKLSKTIAHALRHEPELYGLKVDSEGWASLADLQLSLQKFLIWRQLHTDDIIYMIESSPKMRFEIKEDKIRALYGHSFESRVEKLAVSPPQYLFHGTTREDAQEILETGLTVLNRQYVHLSADQKGAYNVGRHRAYQPAILRIAAEQASKEGINFYVGNDVIWLVDSIPVQYITLDVN